jgi:peptidyl-prolyl cis-trans isomerase SurA
MKQQNGMNLRYTAQRNKAVFLWALLLMAIGARAQVMDSSPDTQVEPPEGLADAGEGIRKDTVSGLKRVKLDGIAAVVGDYVILDSDVEKALIDIRSQGASTEDITHCNL